MKHKVVHKTAIYSLIYLLRGLAVIGVVLFHAAYPVLQVHPFFSTFFTANVHASLRMFFFLSGFALGAGYLQRRYTLTLTGILKFWLRRVGKLAPIYYLTVLYLMLRTDPWTNQTVTDIWRLMTFRSSPVTAVHQAGFLWFISTLVQFYLIAPLGFSVLLVIKKKTAGIFFPLFFLTGIVGIAVRIFLIPKITYETMYASLLLNLDVFIQGLFLAGAVQHSQLKNLPDRVLLYWVAGIYLVLLTAGSLYLIPYSANVSRLPFVIGYIPFAAITGAGLIIYMYRSFSLVAQQYTGFVAAVRNVLISLGIYSLEIYIFHVLIQEYFGLYCFEPCDAAKYGSHVILFLSAPFILAVLLRRITTALGGSAHISSSHKRK